MARRILLADDSVTAQNMGRRILTDAGYEVLTVNNGSAALKKIAEFKPDLIVLDVYMPGYGGLEVCQRVKESQETKRTPVLLTVGKLEPFKAEEAKRVGADAFIIKPFEATELLTVLTKLEDKIVAQPQPQKTGRFAKALAAVEQSDKGDQFGDEQTGWKNRLTIPGPESKPKAEGDVPEPVVGISHNLEQGEAVKPAAPSREVEGQIPAGLPADITPEELAAIASAAAAFGGAAESVVANPETVAADSLASAVSTESQDAPSSEVAPVHFADPDAPAATLTSAPETIQPELAQPEAVQAEAVQSEIVPPEIVEAAAQPEATQPEVAETEAVHAEVAQQEIAQETHLEVPAEAQPVAAESVSEAVADSEPANAVANVEEQAVPPELPTLGASAGTASSEGQPSHAEKPGDDEVMAAIAALAPALSHTIESIQPVAHGSNGAGQEAAVAVNPVAAGPRWIAEPVAVGAEESKLGLEQEMEQAHVALAHAAELAAARAIEAQTPAAITEAAETLSQQPLAIEEPAAVTAVQTFAEAIAVTESVPASIAVEGAPVELIAQEPIVQDGTISEAAAIQTALEEVPQVAEPVVAEYAAPDAASDVTHAVPQDVRKESAYAAAASAGPTSHAPSVEAVSSATVSPEISESAPVASVEAAPQREADLAAAWQNWKQIRESFAGSQPPPQVAETPAAEASPAKEKSAVSTKPAQAAEPEEVEETAEVEATSAEGPGESTAIASIVDTMLAELRPKLVAEIAKKMNSEKEKKEKKKRK